MAAACDSGQSDPRRFVFFRRLPEFKFWYSLTKAFCVAFVLTFFSMCAVMQRTACVLLVMAHEACLGGVRFLHALSSIIHYRLIKARLLALQTAPTTITLTLPAARYARGPHRASFVCFRLYFLPCVLSQPSSAHLPPASAALTPLAPSHLTPPRPSTALPSMFSTLTFPPQPPSYVWRSFNIPVFWPILLMYFIALFVLTMKRQIKHMIKYRYIPFSFGKTKYKGKGEGEGGPPVKSAE